MMKPGFFLRNFISVTLPVFFVVLLLGGVALYITVNGSRETINTINEQTIARIRESTEIIFSEADAQSLNYSVSPYVLLRLEELLDNGYSEKEYLDNASMIKNFLDSNVNSKSFLHSVYIYLDNDAGNFFTSSQGIANSLNSWDVMWMERINTVPLQFRQWLEIRKVKSSVNSAMSVDIITLYKRLYRSGKREPGGIIVVNIYQNYLNSLYKNYLSFPNQAIFLLNNDRTILCKAGNIDASADISDIGLLGKSYFIAEEKNSAYGITWYSLIPKNTVSFQARNMLMIVVSVLLLTLALGGGLAYLTTRRGTKALKGIIGLLYSAERGEALPDLRPSDDAYGYITQNIVKTFLEKNRLDRQLMEKKLAMEAMHFSLLQSQLNPHFLFNTLKNIFWKVVRLTGKPNDASRMVELLSGVLRYALVNREKYVSVKEEIENTRKYLEIQQLRFDNAFGVTWTLEGNFDSAECIKFILQPLVENCITHGFGDRDKISIDIFIAEKDRGILFAVKDNGCGFTRERLEAIMSSFLLELSPAENTGLYNLNKRLTLVYGEKSALIIESGEQAGTSVSFFIPRQDDNQKQSMS